MEAELQVQRFEQQLAAFEKLHREELKEFERKLKVFIQLQEDEVKLLREQLDELKQTLKESDHTRERNQ